MALILKRMILALPEGVIGSFRKEDAERLTTMTYEDAATLLKGRIGSKGIGGTDRAIVPLCAKLYDCGFFTLDDDVSRFRSIAVVAMCEMVLLAQRARVASAA